MPFIYETFYQDEPKLAFSILMRRYNLSMGEAQRLIDLKRVYNNGELVEVKNKKLSGEIKVLRFKPISRGLKPIFKSPNFLIFDKPSGVIIHPKKIETPYSLLDEMRTFGSSESNSAHRIDKETSGLVLVSMRKVDEVILKKMFENKSIKKSYLAWVRGKTKESFRVDRAIKIRRDYTTSKHKVELSRDGKVATTHFKRLIYDRERDISLVEATPITGRTHQIRIHLYSVGHPIFGEPLYGTSFEFANRYLDGKITEDERIKFTGAKRLMLHANSLDFKFNGIRYIIKSKMEFKL